MLFQSWQYLLLLITAIITVFLVKNTSIKKIAILCLSMFFYAYGAGWQTVVFVLVMLATNFVGLLVEKHKSKILLTFVLLVLFSPLILYKYIPFIFTEILNFDLSTYKDVFVLPIGISFYTFQAVGYVIDVFKGTTRAERNPLNLWCFISFFPQLVAGPIERSNNIMEQIREFKKPDYDTMASGFRHILLGLTLKLLIAETMADFVNPVYRNLSSRGGLAVIVAALCFGVQIYCDFNGYTQIAIGSADLLGVKLMQNFDHPYTAKSVSEFWRRWHISLTSWFKDYVYIPLGGNRKGKVRTYLNSLVTFTLSGIWHGANWTFVVWGFVNGVTVAVEKSFIKKLSKNKILSACYAVVAFLLVNLFLVIFRADSLSDAFLCYKLIFTDSIPQLLSLTSLNGILNFLLKENGWSQSSFLPMAISMVIYLWYEYGFGKNRKLENFLFSEKTVVRWITYFVLILATLYFGRTLEQSAFVYFRF